VIGALASCQRTPDPRATEDQRCADAVADGRVTEARAWLADPAHKGLDVSPAQMRDVAEHFYKAGAPRVLAAWNTLDGAQVCALFVVDLPAAPDARAAIVAVAAALPEAEAVKDVGQRCLLVPLE
jgi:hypothetical protein